MLNLMKTYQVLMKIDLKYQSRYFEKILWAIKIEGKALMKDHLLGKEQEKKIIEIIDRFMKIK